MVDERLNLETALALAQDARQRWPNDARGHDALGWVYLHKGFTEMALRELAEAVKLAPNDPSFRYHLGVAHQRTGNALRAREQFTRALGLSVRFPEETATRSALDALR
jgi:Flp pilus assembly protein TadD